ncbi:hypothetical protein K491DRAFT_681645 [Lophiostoma macrostomum CBS 122681]|uniref:dolichol kinase n=1 Tax=Lophiostoma macrostomum CBS 122681 TaxID=1314788 RepID=A0A6A6SYI1_9PLEO|nr:hypothetical protein K491DRAFT_681645 [Lophiostoma macrostomum CBS 122681]
MALLISPARLSADGSMGNTCIVIDKTTDLRTTISALHRQPIFRPVTHQTSIACEARESQTPIPWLYAPRPGTCAAATAFHYPHCLICWLRPTGIDFAPALSPTQRAACPVVVAALQRRRSTMSQELEARDAPLGVESLELFRRSPHPYHRRQQELRSTQACAESSQTDLLRATTLQPAGHTISDQDGRKRRKTSQSPSESGTEADDEGYGFVKALPAPPFRPRKGLRHGRGSRLDGAASPLLTPAQIDDEGRQLAQEYFGPPTEASSRPGAPSPTDDEATAARQKYLRRRRNELVRRATEAALLGLLGLLAVRGCSCWPALLQWHKELVTHALAMAGVLALYPLRLLYYSTSREPPSHRRYRQRIRIPAAFDPAPILYPALLPVIIAVSLHSSAQKLLLPNMLLGLAALPPQLIPLAQSGAGYSAVHWFVAVLPLLASENTQWPSKYFASMPYRLRPPPPGDGLHPEMLASLFALHQALLPPLRYLTTTSLLPAELHLLSIGLINLLLFAESPQAVVLQTLLWLGGLGLFATCGKVLKWGVALARIPRWRFRHVGHVIKARQNFLQVLNETLKPRSRSAARAISDSDADEDEFPLVDPLTNAQILRLNTQSLAKPPLLENGEEPRSAVETAQGTIDQQREADTASSPRRRYTLPSLPSHRAPPRQPTHRHRSKSTVQSFLSLTPTQALRRKWIYAGYFYLVVVLMILFPIRFFISTRALNSHEPFGWAVGYLFGNVRSLRFETFNRDLDSWITLPPLDYMPYPTLSSSDTNATLAIGIADNLRIALGPASTRLLLTAYFFLIIVLGLLTVLSSPLTTHFEVDTRRKVFHGMMVGMLLPTIFIDPLFISLALVLVLSVFLLLDLVRASQLPPLSKPIAKFLTPYVDGRDLRGPVVVSHIFLLIGCAIPVWLSLAGVDRAGEEPWTGWEVETGSRDVSLIAGVVCVGMGDAAASLIGRRWGRRKWPWAGGKSLEGSAAFALAVTVGLVFGKAWLRIGGWERGNGRFGGLGVGWAGLKEWGTVLLKAGVCAMGASLNEAVLTGGNDNVIVPVVLWLLVRGVGL